VANYGIALLTKSILQADINVPATSDKAAFTAKANILDSRVCLTRKGTKYNGDGFEIRELTNIKIGLTKNVPPSVRKIVENFASKYSKIVTTRSGDPSVTCKSGLHTDISNTMPTTKATGTKNIAKAMKGRPPTTSKKARKITQPVRAKVKKMMKTMKK